MSEALKIIRAYTAALRAAEHHRAPMREALLAEKEPGLELVEAMAELATVASVAARFTADYFAAIGMAATLLHGERKVRSAAELGCNAAAESCACVECRRDRERVIAAADQIVAEAGRRP